MASSSMVEGRRSRLPFVFLNLALSADGKIATANRTVTSFGSPRDLRHLYELRATADAVMCGARTVEQSQATLGNGGESFLGVRRRAGLHDYPVRVLVSGSGTISPAAEIWTKRFSPLVVLTTERASQRRRQRLEKLADHVWIMGNTEINFLDALHRLHSEFGVKRLLCEGGGEVNDALFRASLVDEINLTLCPLLFGGRRAPTLADGQGFAKLTDAANFDLKSVRHSGDEYFLVYQRATPAI